MSLYGVKSFGIAGYLFILFTISLFILDQVPCGSPGGNIIKDLSIYKRSEDQIKESDALPPKFQTVGVTVVTTTAVHRS